MPPHNPAYTSWMEQEMHEAPAVLARLQRAWLAEGAVWPTSALAEQLGRTERVVWTSCGSSRHASALGQMALAALAQIPSHIEAAHQLYAVAPAAFVGASLCVAMSQSGQTQDTLDACALAEEAGCPLLAVTNAPDSPMAQRARFAVALQAGRERAVPATKSFLAQAYFALALAVAAARRRGQAPREALAVHAALDALPQTLAHMQAAQGPKGAHASAIARAIDALARSRQAFLVGRGAAAAAAEEGALKLQETAYAPARAYALGEFKHGPMAMIDPEKDVLVALVGPNEPMDKVAPALRRLCATGARTLFLTAQDDDLLAALRAVAPNALSVTTPPTHPLVWPLLAVATLQRLALGVATLRGAPIDAPRYLTKQITEN